MKRYSFKEITISDVTMDSLNLFQDSDGVYPILPTLWLIHMSIIQEVWGWRTERRPDFMIETQEKATRIFESKPVSDNTAINYIGHLYKLLSYIEKFPELSVHQTDQLTSRFLNHYLNDVLPDQLGSADSLESHQAAIAAYCNFLIYIDIWNVNDFKKTSIYRKTRQYMHEKADSPKKIKYVTKEERIDLLATASCHRDKLILRMGYEVGLRAEENCGLELNDFRSHKGLLTLFSMLDDNPNQMSFEYVLRGIYTKGGRSGSIFFDRELLEDMRKYHETERAETIEEANVVCNTLFVRGDNEGKGLPISPSHATTIFRDIRKELQYLNETLSYHDLRHTFATELYHEELLNESGQETRSESAALEVVRARLRHVEGSTTTKIYIRLREVMLIREKQGFL